MITARLTPRQRARVRQELHQVASDLYGSGPTPALDTSPGFVVDVLTRPDTAPSARTADPDREITYEHAARISGLSVSSLRRYAAPSRRRVERLGAGLSLVSVQKLTADRMIGQKSQAA